METLCTICGGKVETPGHDTCYGCHLDGLIPSHYSEHEGYTANSDHVMAATRHPKTDNGLLDERSPTRIVDLPRNIADAIISRDRKEIDAIMGGIS